MKAISSLIFLGALGALLLTGPGCEDQEAPRSLLQVTRIAETSTEQYYDNYIIQSDVANVGADGLPGTADDSVEEDMVYITVQNIPRSELLSMTASSPFGAVILTGYRVDYEVEGEHILPLEGGLHLTVHSGSEAMARITIVSAISKIRPPLSTLATTADEFIGKAHITLYGYEETSEEAIEARASMGVHFANWADG